LEYFKITKEELSSLFEPDNIHDHLSWQKFLSLGGIEGLCKGMRINIKQGLSMDDREMREDHYGRNDPVFAP
jgi:hypothetical protein